MPLKENAILLFAFKGYWKPLLVDTLSHGFCVNVIFADEIITEFGTKHLVSVINKTAIESGSEIIFIEVDFYPSIDSSLIRMLQIKKRVMFTFDDLMLHNRNALTAADGCCDLVLTADPLSVLKYEEKKINAHLLFHDLNVPAPAPEPIKKTTDVLFFGDVDLANRREYIQFLQDNNIGVKVVGGKEFISREQMAEEIAAAKIILNLSESFNSAELCRFGYSQISPFFSLLQFKLRIIEAGLLKTACVSEYAPAIGLMFSANEVPLFKSKSECLKIISDLLGDERQLQEYAVSLSAAVLARYEASVLLPSIVQKLGSSAAIPLSVDIPANYYIDTLKHRIKNTHNNRRLKHSFRELADFSYPSNQALSVINAKIFSTGLVLVLKLLFAGAAAFISRLAGRIGNRAKLFSFPEPS